MTEPTAPFSNLAPVDPDKFLTVEQVKASVPTTLKSSITQTYVDKLNAITTDELTRDEIQRNFISYTGVLKDGKFKTEDYLYAVTFVSFKLMGYSDKDSWIKTFPDRYTACVAQGFPEKQIASYVSIYKKGKLVNLIMEQCLVPTWVLNQNMFQDALNVQYDLMKNADSEKVRTEAANSLLTHLKKPEAVKNSLSISLSDKDNSGMAALTAAMQELASNQRQAIQNGSVKTIDVAATRLVPKDDE